MKPPVKFHWRGIHHLYLGLWFFSFGLFFLYMNLGNRLDFLNGFYSLLVVVGLYLVCDDLIEHIITEDTPLRRLWNWALRHRTWW
jgi:hypothetical protein